MARSILRIDKPTGGNISVCGKDIAALPRRKLRPLRKEISLIFQIHTASLDPRQTAGDIVGEPLIVNGLVKNKTGV